MSRKRILHLIDTGGPGGAETIYGELVAGLSTRGWESHAVVPEDDWLAEHLRARGIEPIILPTTRSFDVRYLFRLLRICRDEEIDLIQAHLLASAVYGSAVARLLRLPAVCTFHGTVDLAANDALQGVKIRVLDRPGNTIVFVSDALREAFSRSCDIPEERTRVVHNGIDTRKYGPAGDPSFRGEMGAGEGEFLLGAIGNVRAPKGYPILLEAMARLRSQGVPVRLVVVGDVDDSLFPELLEARAELGLESTVEFTGFRDDVPRILGSLDALVLSSTAEGFSLSVVEALASGVPVISTRCGGPEEILEDGQTGILVEAGSPDAIAEGVERLVREAGLRSRLSRAGKERAERAFSLSTMLERYEALYTRALHGTEPPGERVRIGFGP